MRRRDPRLETPTLPYSAAALEPHLSERAVSLHLDFHRGCIERLEALLPAGDGGDPDRLVKDLPPGEAFDHAAQCWNHDFYWRCMTPGGSDGPGGGFGREIESTFGSLASLRDAIIDAGVSPLRPGWIWVAGRSDGEMVVCNSADMGTPLHSALTPLLGVDLWEHAYLLDYGNDREAYLRAWLDDLVDWEFAAFNHEQWRRAVQGAAEVT